jgi:1,2-phenylacetyl-CoA epoxidase catalytic subunit
MVNIILVQDMHTGTTTDYMQFLPRGEKEVALEKYENNSEEDLIVRHWVYAGVAVAWWVLMKRNGTLLPNYNQ